MLLCHTATRSLHVADGNDSLRTRSVHNWLFSAVTAAAAAVEGRIGGVRCAMSRKLVVIGRQRWHPYLHVTT